MSAKSTFIVVLTALVTIILMKNMDEVDFWIFGTYSISKLLVLAVIFFLGMLIGWLLGRGKKKKETAPTTSYLNEEEDIDEIPPREISDGLSQEDRDYIK